MRKAKICAAKSKCCRDYPGLWGATQVASTSGVIGLLAGRYATALYDLADEAKALDETADDLKALKALIAENVELDRLVRGPLIDRAAKGRAMAAILIAAGAYDLTRRFVGLVALNGRLFVLTAIIDAFLAELARRRGEVSAEVASAVPLSQSQATAVAEAIRQAVGGHVAVSRRVDPGLIGGLVVRVGSRMIDTSLSSKLLRLQLAMKEAS